MELSPASCQPAPQPEPKPQRRSSTRERNAVLELVDSPGTLAKREGMELI